LTSDINLWFTTLNQAETAMPEDRSMKQTTNRTALLTPTDAGYVVSHADVRSGEHLDTAITLTQRVELEIEDRGHEMVLAERAKRHR